MRSYTESQRAEAIALPLTDKEVAVQLGIPRRTVTYWRTQYRQGRHSSATPIIEATREQYVAQLAQVEQEAATAMLAKVRDRSTRGSDLAQIYRVVSERRALLTGGVTSRSEASVMTLAERVLPQGDIEALRAWLGELNDGLPGGVLDLDRAAQLGAFVREQLTDGKEPAE